MAKRNYAQWQAHVKVANHAMRRMGVTVPQVHHIYYVRLSKIPVPPVCKSLAGLSRESDCVWLRSKRTADALVAVDRHLGGDGSSTPFEFQTCLVCKRILLGAEATTYQVRRRWPRSKCYWPWGPQCSAVCEPSPARKEEAIRLGLTRYDRLRKEWEA